MNGYLREEKFVTLDVGSCEMVSVNFSKNSLEKSNFIYA